MYKRRGKKRFKMSRKSSRRSFSRGAKVRKKNTARAMRGGFRL